MAPPSRESLARPLRPDHRLRRKKTCGGVDLGAVDLVSALDDLIDHSAPVLRSALGANPHITEDSDHEALDEQDSPATVAGWTAFRWSSVLTNDR